MPSSAVGHALILEQVGSKHQARCACGGWRSHRYDDPAFAEHRHRNHVWHATTDEDERRRQIDRAETELRRRR